MAGWAGGSLHKNEGGIQVNTENTAVCDGKRTMRRTKRKQLGQCEGSVRIQLMAACGPGLDTNIDTCTHNHTYTQTHTHKKTHTNTYTRILFTYV